MTSRQFQFVEQFVHAPDANPVAVVAPGKSSGIRGREFVGHRMAQAGTKSKMLDVQRKINRQPLSIRKGIVRAFGDG